MQGSDFRQGSSRTQFIIKRGEPMDIPSYTLKSGYKMPVLGLGTWQLTGKQYEKRDMLF